MVQEEPIPALPLVSVVTATFNSRRFLRETAESVLSQDVERLEWVIVDDGSTDGTPDVVRRLADPRIRLFVKPENTGIGDTYEQAVAAARGDLILILDHDDTVPTGSLQARIEALRDCASCMAATGPVAYMDEAGKVYSEARLPFARGNAVVGRKRALLSVFLAPTYPVKQGGVLLRGCFVIRHPRTFDVELLLEALREGPLAYVEETSLHYRTFRGQHSSSRMERVRMFLNFHWSRYALRYLPWYLGIPVAVYRTLLEAAKVGWALFSPRRI